MCQNNGKFVVLTQSCGGVRAVPADCGDPLCKFCEPMRARARAAAWLPILEKMHNPSLFSVTIKNGENLQERLFILFSSWRRFLDLRLGPRNLPKFLALAHDFVITHFEEQFRTGDILEGEKNYRIKHWEKSLDRFGLRVSKSEKPRLRDFLGYGFGALEITFSELELWHAHLHVVIDAGFLPWPFLVECWKIATKGEGSILDIRALGKTSKDILEVTKYVTKFWEIPEDRFEELRKAIKGKKRVWPIGGAKPEEVKHVCPCCGKDTCLALIAQIGDRAQRIKTVTGRDVLKLFTRNADDILELRLFSLVGMTWREVEPESVYLILRELACHSTPAPPGNQINLFGSVAGV